MRAQSLKGEGGSRSACEEKGDSPEIRRELAISSSVSKETQLDLSEPWNSADWKPGKVAQEF